jgi:3-hydroxyacyl-CoA dehydrogenase
LLVEKGRLGQKTKAGAFDYVEGSRRPVRSTEVEVMIEAEAARLGVARRVVSDDEIRDRCLFALINEGAELLAEGVAESSMDVDTIWCNGYGFPRYRGGPLWYADEVGLPQVLSGIRGLAGQLGERYWRASPLLVDLVRQGADFATWKQV